MQDQCISQVEIHLISTFSWYWRDDDWHLCGFFSSHIISLKHWLFLSFTVIPDGYSLAYVIGDGYIWWTITTLKNQMQCSGGKACEDGQLEGGWRTWEWDWHSIKNELQLCHFPAGPSQSKHLYFPVTCDLIPDTRFEVDCDKKGFFSDVYKGTTRSLSKF